jgi:hypothetical protein
VSLLLSANINVWRQNGTASPPAAGPRAAISCPARRLRGLWRGGWQIVDSAFPTGAFAHSFGLEAAWQQGEMPDIAVLREFVQEAIVHW